MTVSLPKSPVKAPEVRLVLARSFGRYADLKNGFFEAGNVFTVSPERAEELLSIVADDRKVFFVEGTEPEATPATPKEVNHVTFKPPEKANEGGVNSLDDGGDLNAPPVSDDSGQDNQPPAPPAAGETPIML